MKKMISLSAKLFICNLLFLGIASAAGLSGGDQYSAIRIEGQLTVQCPGANPATAQAYCGADLLNPGEYSYFVNGNKDADHVSLQATREDGSVSKAKTVEYDSAKGISKKSFNLWIRTVLQRPLLDFGKNTVHYKMTKNGTTVEEGDFVVTVADGGRFSCRRIGHYISTLPTDCATPQNLCSRFFQENNYCQ